MRRVPRLRLPSSGPIAASVQSPLSTPSFRIACSAQFSSGTSESTPTRPVPQETRICSHSISARREFHGTPAVQKRTLLRPKSTSKYEFSYDDPSGDMDEAAAEEQWALKQEGVQTGLKVPGPVRTAPRSEEIVGQGYTPADTADGLEEVGGLEQWWENDQNWSRDRGFFGFGRQEKVQDPAVLEVFARRAVVEALAAQQSSDAGALTSRWAAGGQDELQRALQINIEVSQDGTPQLQGDVGGVIQDLQRQPQDEEQGIVHPPSRAELLSDEALVISQTWNDGWKRIDVSDARVKFALAKRLQQLTGHLITDSKLRDVHTVQELIAVLAKPPKAKKLAEELELRQNLLELPNVKLHAKRVTPIDKEQAVGRWKVIVKELEKRGLPVTGTGGHGRPISKAWIMGKP